MTDWTLIVDSREPDPHPWEPILNTIKMRRHMLDCGDFSLDGFTDLVAIERKTLGDLISCCTRNRDRFERELGRSRVLHRFCVIVEASWTDVLKGRYRSLVSPESILGSLSAFWARWGVPFYFCGTQEAAAQVAQSLLFQWAQKWTGSLRSGKNAKKIKH